MEQDSSHFLHMQRVYDQICEHYAVINRPMPANLASMAKAFLALAPDGPLLDVGCGCGRDVAFLASRGRLVWGIDLSLGMLTQAQQILPRTSESAAGLAQMNMLRLGFPAGSFAGVWCCAALLHLPKTLAPAALSQIRRVVRPDGIFSLELQAGQSESWETWPADQDSQVQRFFARYQVEEALEIVRQAGFSLIHHTQQVVGQRTWLSFLLRAVPLS